MKLAVIVLGLAFLTPMTASALDVTAQQKANQAFYALSQTKGPTLNDEQVMAGVADIEAHLHVADVADLSQYAHYYAQDKNGHIIGLFAKLEAGEAWTPGPHIVALNQLPIIMDGGCSFIDVIYLPGTRAMAGRCHGLA